MGVPRALRRRDARAARRRVPRAAGHDRATTRARSRRRCRGSRSIARSTRRRRRRATGPSSRCVTRKARRAASRSPVTAKLRGRGEASASTCRPAACPSRQRASASSSSRFPPLDPLTRRGDARDHRRRARRASRRSRRARSRSRRSFAPSARSRSDRATTPWLRRGSLDSVKLPRAAPRAPPRARRRRHARRRPTRRASSIASPRTSSEASIRTRDAPGTMRRAIRHADRRRRRASSGSTSRPRTSAASTRKYPLVVGLHGMNGYPMAMMRCALRRATTRSTISRGRIATSVPLPPVDAFVITPYGTATRCTASSARTTSCYAVAVGDEAFPDRRDARHDHRPVDGRHRLGRRCPSTARTSSPPPRRSAATTATSSAATSRARAMRPWERSSPKSARTSSGRRTASTCRSTSCTARRICPEENSGVLIERYEKLNYSIKHEHPEAGHNVWRQTYDELKGLKWLLGAAARSPSLARSLQDDAHALRARARGSRSTSSRRESRWGEVDARVQKSKTSITLDDERRRAAHARARRPLLDAASAPSPSPIDGTTLALRRGRSARACTARRAARGRRARATHAGARKARHGHGPAPRRVPRAASSSCYGAATRMHAPTSRSRARFAKIRPGVQVAYPVMSDTEFLARERAARERSRALPRRSHEQGARRARARTGARSRSRSSRRRDGRHASASRARSSARRSFVRTRLRPDRYVVVVAGADVAGHAACALAAGSPPRLRRLGRGLAPSRGQILLGAGSLRAGGLFTKDWSLPAQIADPLAQRTLRARRSRRRLRPAPPGSRHVTAIAPSRIG